MDESLRARFMIEPLNDDELRERLPERFSDQAEQSGFFPNSMRIMARNPDLARAIGELGRVVMYSGGKVDRRLKWLAGHMASRASGCRYCAAHAVTYASDQDNIEAAKVEAVWNFETSPLFDDAERAALRFARAAGSCPNEVTPAHFDELHRYYDDDQIVEIAAVVCTYGFLNRWNDSFATPLERETLEFGLAHLAPTGWDPGRNGPSTTAGV